MSLYKGVGMKGYLPVRSNHEIKIGAHTDLYDLPKCQEAVYAKENLPAKSCVGFTDNKLRLTIPPCQSFEAIMICSNRLVPL